ncbi:MAG: META domain-containing protein [Chitinophagaceae bacterium]|nr:META domain-containing protein [Chitinophagaceae bacterium]
MKHIILCALVISFFSCSPKLAPDSDWGRQRWVLVDLKGVPVQLSGSNRDAFVEFSTSDKRVSGNGGCNRFNGTYVIEKKGSIKFNEVVSTKMSCPDIAFETAFLEALNAVDRYDTEENSLFLKDGNKVMMILKSR